MAYKEIDTKTFQPRRAWSASMVDAWRNLQIPSYRQSWWSYITESLLYFSWMFWLGFFIGLVMGALSASVSKVLMVFAVALVTSVLVSTCTWWIMNKDKPKHPGYTTADLDALLRHPTATAKHDNISKENKND